MKSAQSKNPTRLIVCLLASLLIVDMLFLAFLLVSAGGFQSLFFSGIRFASFAMIIFASLLTVWLIRKTYRSPGGLTVIAAQLQSINRFMLVTSLLGLSIIAGINFLLFPAFGAYQILVDIPRLYPKITPAVGWLTVETAILFIVAQVIRANAHSEDASVRNILNRSLLISLGLLILSLYISSIFIAWFAQRGFRFF